MSVKITCDPNVTTDRWWNAHPPYLTHDEIDELVRKVSALPGPCFPPVAGELKTGDLIELDETSCFKKVTPGPGETFVPDVPAKGVDLAAEGADQSVEYDWNIVSEEVARGAPDGTRRIVVSPIAGRVGKEVDEDWNVKEEDYAAGREPS